VYQTTFDLALDGIKDHHPGERYPASDRHQNSAGDSHHLRDHTKHSDSNTDRGCDQCDHQMALVRPDWGRYRVHDGAVYQYDEQERVLYMQIL